MARRRRTRADFAAILRRNIAADGWLPKYRAIMRRVLDGQVADVVRAIRAGQSPSAWAKRFRGKWERELVKAQMDIVLEMAAEGYQFGLKEFDRMAQKPKGKAELIDLGFSVEQLKATRLRADVEKYLKETSKLETATSIQRYGRYHEIAIETGMTTGDMARLIVRPKGLALNRTRAELMARTTTIWAYNEGATQLYKDEGVGAMEWVATIDILTDDECANADGEQQPIGQTFSTGVVHPPTHPNCRCAVVPVVLPEQVRTSEQEVERQKK